MDNNDIPTINSAEDFMAEVRKMGLDRELNRALGKDAPRPIILADPKTELYLQKFISCSCDKLKNLTRRWSNVDDPVMITGESGTGKELIAKALHGGRKGNFVAINCAGFVSNESLMESVLFGHERGSFTGAESKSLGLIRHADGGTVFLDEVAELPIHTQAKLLRLLQEGKVRPLGSLQEYEVKVRVVCATKENIEERVEQRKFREDLYYRLSFGRLHIPPLRERPEDVTLILAHLFNGKVPEGFTMPNDLRGNVRSLQQAVRRFIVEVGCSSV